MSNSLEDFFNKETSEERLELIIQDKDLFIKMRKYFDFKDIPKVLIYL